MSTGFGRAESALPEGIADAEWDLFLTQCPFAHHEQSSAFARNRASYGFALERVTTRDGEIITGGAQVLVQRTPLGKLAIVQRGPVALSDDAATLHKIARKLDSQATERGYQALRIDLFPHQAVARNALQTAGFAPIPNASGMVSASVPLACPEQELLGRMSSRVGREVRRATLKGVEVRTGRDTLGDIYALYQKTSAHHGFPSFPLAYFETLWQTLGANGRLESFVAYFEDRPVAGILNSVVGDEMYYGWGGMSRAPEDKALRANFLLHWSAILNAKRNGLKRYDLAGESPFKQWFAIERIEWPAPLWKFNGWLGPRLARATTAPAPSTQFARILQRLGRSMTPQPRMPH